MSFVCSVGFHFVGGKFVVCRINCEPSATQFSMGEATLCITDTTETQLIRSNGLELGALVKGFRMRYEDGRFVSGVSFKAVDNELNRFLVTYEDGSIAKYKIEQGEGFVLLHLKT